MLLSLNYLLFLASICYFAVDELTEWMENRQKTQERKTENLVQALQSAVKEIGRWAISRFYQKVV